MSIRDHLAKVLGQTQNVFANSDIATRRFVQTRGFTLSNGGFTLPKDGFSLPRNGFSLPGLQQTQGNGLVAKEMQKVNEELAGKTKEPDAEASIRGTHSKTRACAWSCQGHRASVQPGRRRCIWGGPTAPRRATHHRSSRDATHE